MGNGWPAVPHCLHRTDAAALAVSLLAAFRGLCAAWLLTHLIEEAQQKPPDTINLEPAVNSSRMQREAVKASDFHLLDEHKCSSLLGIQTHLILCLWHSFESHFRKLSYWGEIQATDGNKTSRKFVEVGVQQEHELAHEGCLFSFTSKTSKNGPTKEEASTYKVEKERDKWGCLDGSCYQSHLAIWVVARISSGTE